MTIRIWQMKNRTDYRFADWNWAKDKFNIHDYSLVYEYKENGDVTPDEVFHKFNVNRPDDFNGHSLSMSDIVQLNDKHFYCDEFGWEDVTSRIIQSILTD